MENILIFLARWFPWVLVIASMGIVAYDHRKVRKFFREWITLASAVFTAWLVAVVLKTITHVPRPFVIQGTIAGVANTFWVKGFTSFPSGHATVFFALAAALYGYHKKWGIVFFVGAVIIAVSRVLLGVHSWLDIGAGALIGLGIGALAYNLFRKNVNYLFSKKAL